MSKLIELAKCTKPHGIKGGFLIHLHNQSSSFLQKGKRVQIISVLHPEGCEMEISSIQYGNKTIGYFQGIEDRNAIEALLPFSIQAQREELEEPQEGEFYLTDLVGLEVYDDDSKELIGAIKSFYDNGAQDVMVISMKQGAILELPFVEAFVPEVNLDEGKVFVIVPEVME